MRMFDEYVELLEFIAELEEEDFDFGEYFAQHPDGAKHECLAIRLQNAGYLNGLCLFGEMDGQTLPRIMWARSRPHVTLSGYEFLEKYYGKAKRRAKKC